MRAKVYICIVFALTFTCTAIAEEIPRTISVTGTCEQRVAPDRAVWNISCSDTSMSITEAKAQSDKKLNNLMALARELEVAPEDIQSSTVNVRRAYEYEYDERDTRKQVFIGFRVSRSVRITQHDLSKLDLYLEKLLNVGDIEVSLDFENSNMETLRWETRLEALKLAKKKAETMVEVLDAKLGEVLIINEHPAGSGSVPVLRNTALPQETVYISSGEGDTTRGTFAPGAIPVKVTVYVTFKIKG